MQPKLMESLWKARTARPPTQCRQRLIVQPHVRAGLPPARAETVRRPALPAARAS